MKRLIVILLAGILLLTSCDADNPAYVNSDDPINVAVDVLTQANPGYSVMLGEKSHDGAYIIAAIDPIGRSIVTTAVEHAELHSGEYFSSTYVKDVAAGDNATIMIITPPAPDRDHMYISIESESEAQFQIYEAPTSTSNGTAIPAVNRERSSALTAETLVFHTPTLSDIGNLLFTWHWVAGKGVGGVWDETQEWLLAPSTKYIFRVTNEAVGNNYISIELHWYKHGLED